MEEHQRGVEDAWAAGWNMVTARAAVDAHMTGTFVYSWQLRIDAPRYPPIRAALNQRIAAARSATYIVVGPERAPGRFETEEAERLQSLLEDLERSTFADLAMMGFSVWQHPIEIDPVTLRHRVTMIERWPLAAVERTSWDGRGPEGYFAITKEGDRIPLPKPGTTDGHWTIVGEGDQPHLDGAILALDASYVAGQMARRAFSNLTNTLGKASVVGELPDTIATTDPAGVDMLKMVKSLGTTQTAGVHQKGARVYAFEVTTRTGELLPDMTNDQVRMVAWALLGHDASITRGDTVYNDPTAQAVPEDLTREGVKVYTGAVNSILALLSRLNIGAEAEPPKLVGVLPDSDQDARLKAAAERAKGRAERHALLIAAIEAERGLGLVTQQRVNLLAAEFDAPAPIIDVTSIEPLAEEE
jgi:hypothetical protein